MNGENPDQEIEIIEDIADLITLSFDGAEFRTRSTKKFLNHRPYTPPCPKKVSAFIPGTITKIFVKEKQKVVKGDPLLSLQAMKMNNILLAPVNGTVKKIYVKKNEVVVKSHLLVELR